MTPESALFAGVAALWLKTSLAMWLILAVLLMVDCRKSITAAWVVCMVICGLASLRSWPQSPATPIHLWLSGLNLLLVVASGFLGVRQWLSSSPNENLGEGAKKDHPDKTSPSGGYRPGQIRVPIRIVIAILAWTGGLIAVCSLMLLHSPRFSGSSADWLAVSHLLATAIALANITVCGLELTFFSSPDTVGTKSFAAVAWRRLAWLALAAFVVELLMSLLIFLSPSEPGDDTLISGILPRAFAISVVFVQFISWMVPHRVYGFQQAAKVSGWVSLTLSAWIAAVTLGVVLALPVDWPWQLIL